MIEQLIWPNIIPPDLSELMINILLVLALTISVYIALNNNLIVSIILLSGLSLTVALIYILLDAPDVALTEASINACISTVILLIALTKMKNVKYIDKFSYSGFLIIVILGIFLIYSAKGIPNYGEINSPGFSGLYQYYIKNSGNDIGIPAIIASILASYRGYDTLAETSVILTAGFAISAILGIKKK